MKNFLRNVMGFNELQEATNILSNKIADLQRELDGLEESVKEELSDDLNCDIERQVEDQVEREVDDRLYNYDFDEMKDKIEMLGEESSGFDNRIVDCQERLEALSDKIDTLGIFDRIEALEAKIR